MKKISILLSCLGILSCVSACTYDDNGDGYRHGAGKPGASCETSSDCDSLKCVNFGKGNVCACKNENDTCDNETAEVCTSVTSADETKTEYFVCQKRTTTELADKGEACAQHTDCKSGLYCKDKACADLLGLGESCETNQECQSSYCINKVCTDPSAKAGLGEKCSTIDDCETGLRCINNICAERGEKGSSCSVADDCQVGLTCFNNKCTERGGENSTCSVAEDCQAGLICKANACAKPAQAGETCSETAECVNNLVCITGRCMKSSNADINEPCSDDDNCRTGLYCKENTCQERLAENEPCSANNECKIGLLCSSSVCTKYTNSPKNEPCALTKDCMENLYCKNNKCAEKLSLGGKCSENTDCYSGNCSDGSCVVECNNELCKADNICVDNKCTPIVDCPDSSEKCFLAMKLHPNTNWNYGTIKDNMIDPNVDTYGNTFQFSFPEQDYQQNVDFCIRQIAFLAQFSNKDNASAFNGLDVPFLHLVTDEAGEPHPEQFLTLDMMSKYLNQNYECSSEDQKLSGNEFYTKYETSAIATVVGVFGSQGLGSVKYVRNIIEHLFLESHYEMADGSICYPYNIKDPCCKFNSANENNLRSALTAMGVTENDIDKVFDLSKTGALGVFEAMLGIKDVTCDEYSAMYSGFGYGFYKLGSSRYVTARNTINCIELDLGVKLPFKLNYKSNSSWKDHDFYLDIYTAPSNLMNSSDMFLIKMAPMYSDDFNDVLNFNSSFHPSNNACANNACERHFYSKFDMKAHETENAKKSESEKTGTGFNIIADYNKSNGDSFSCSEKAIRTGLCTPDDEKGPLYSKNITVETHSSQSACQMSNFDEAGEKHRGYKPNAAGASLSDSCKPVAAVEMSEFSVYVELTSEDLKGIEKTAE